jgi:aspartate-semialdehyde dehydrogenase
MLSIAVIGATGAVGLECLSLLDRGMLPVQRVIPVASPRSAGRDLAREQGFTLPLDPVATLEQFDPATADLAVLAAGAELSRRIAERFARAGALVVDNSSAFRMEPDVPLVVPQVNPRALAKRPGRGIVANPNCSTIQLVRVLHPLTRLAEIDTVVLSTYQAASGGGLSGLRELADTSGRVLADPSWSTERAGRFGAPLAFNLVPEIGLPDASGFTHEERKLAREPRKILDNPALRATATAVRVPVFHCHSEAVYVRFGAPVTASAVEETLAATPGIVVHRRAEAADASDAGIPMPRQVFASDERRRAVHVGRIRVDPDDPTAVWLWIVADNLWVGAALNALEIAEAAVEQGWLG